MINIYSFIHQINGSKQYKYRTKQKKNKLNTCIRDTCKKQVRMTYIFCRRVKNNSIEINRNYDTTIINLLA